MGWANRHTIILDPSKRGGMSIAISVWGVSQPTWWSVVEAINRGLKSRVPPHLDAEVGHSVMHIAHYPSRLDARFMQKHDVMRSQNAAIRGRR